MLILLLLSAIEAAAALPGSSCGSGLVYDCELNCVDPLKAYSRIDNGHCDDGSNGIDLVCSAFYYDGIMEPMSRGDCYGSNIVFPGNYCGSDKIYDCSLNCVDIGLWMGDGYCDDGARGVDLNCFNFNYDGGDCLPSGYPGSICGQNKVYDCSLNCVDIDVVDAGVNDGYCHNGTFGEIDLTCPAFNNDGDDCIHTPEPGKSCAPGKIFDCFLNCLDESEIYIQDGYCHDHLNCPIFLNDGGDCSIPPLDYPPGDSCGENKVYDCSLNCISNSDIQPRISNGFCDNSSSEINLNCSDFDYDGGDCPPATDPVPGQTCQIDHGGGFIHGGTYDCDLNCMDYYLYTPSDMINNGICDDGPYVPDSGDPYTIGNLICAAFHYDGKDCLLPAPGKICGIIEGSNIKMIYDCALNCIDKTIVYAQISNKYCDDDSSKINLNCPTFNYDGGACSQSSTDQVIEEIFDEFLCVSDPSLCSVETWIIENNTEEEVICTIETCGTETGEPAFGEDWIRLGGKKPGDRVQLKVNLYSNWAKIVKENSKLEFLLNIVAIPISNNQRLGIPINAGELQVLINGTTYFQINADKKNEYQSYQPVSVPIPEFGGEIDITFISTINDVENESDEYYEAIYFLIDSIPSSPKDCEGESVTINQSINQDYHCEAKSIRVEGDVKINAAVHLKADEVWLNPVLQVKPGAELIIE